MDDEVKAMEAQIEQMSESSPEANQMTEKMKELLVKHDHESNMEYIELMREACSPLTKIVAENDAVKYGGEQTLFTSIEVPTSHDGDFDVPVEVYTPKVLVSEAKRAAYIYAHGVGADAFCAADVRARMQCTAVDMNVVIFNVDYRLAPETKCPNNSKDFYEVIKFVSKNADSLGIDPSKIVIGGESAGGCIILGAMVLLAEHEESNLVKLAIPAIPMVDDYCFSDPLAMTIEERNTALEMQKNWIIIAADFEQQKSSPHLFPGKASEELLEKFPPVIIIETEFDMFITEATRLANRLRRAGRLLEFPVVPGSTHVSGFVPGTKGNKIVTDIYKTIAKEYIHS